MTRKSPKAFKVDDVTWERLTHAAETLSVREGQRVTRSEVLRRLFNVMGPSDVVRVISAQQR